MSGRVRVRLPDGRTVTGYRKTLRRNRLRSDPLRHADRTMPFCLRVTLDRDMLVSPGPTGVIGVEVKAELGEHLVEVTGVGLEWVLRQAATYIGRVGGATERRLKFSIGRGAYRCAGWAIYIPGASVVFPRAVKKALVFAVR